MASTLCIHDLQVNTLSRPCTHTLNTLQSSPTGKTLSYPPTVNTLDLSCMNTRDVQECHVYLILYTYTSYAYQYPSYPYHGGGSRGFGPPPIFWTNSSTPFLQCGTSLILPAVGVVWEWFGCGLYGPPIQNFLPTPMLTQECPTQD